jgi:hypothetical protein
MHPAARLSTAVLGSALIVGGIIVASNFRGIGTSVLFDVETHSLAASRVICIAQVL